MSSVYVWMRVNYDVLHSNRKNPLPKLNRKLNRKIHAHTFSNSTPTFSSIKINSFFFLQYTNFSDLFRVPNILWYLFSLESNTTHTHTHSQTLCCPAVCWRGCVFHWKLWALLSENAITWIRFLRNENLLHGMSHLKMK